MGPPYINTPGWPLEKRRTHADIIMSKLDENKITLDSLSQELNSLEINSEDKAQNKEHHKTESSNIETIQTSTCVSQPVSQPPINKTTLPEPYKWGKIDSFNDCVLHIKNCKNIIIVTGAGISTSVGIPDFRSSGGLYDTIRQRFPDMSDPTDFFSIRYFSKEPKPFYEMASEIWPDNFEPSFTHKFMARLDREGRLQRNYTQNIDTLEQAAGMSDDKVVQCHGSFSKATCRDCKAKFEGSEIKDRIMKKEIPICGRLLKVKHEKRLRTCNGIIKPDIVFFGEGLPNTFFKALEEDGNPDVDNADLILVIGSTMKVSPVNMVPMAVENKSEHAIPTILINCESVSIPDVRPKMKLLGYGDKILKEIEFRMDNFEESELKEVQDSALRKKDGFEESDLKKIKNVFYRSDSDEYRFEGWRDD